MRITEHNYEEFLVRLIEDQLDPEERQEVERFVRNNPNAKQALLEYKRTLLVAPEVAFPNKEKLYKKTNRKIIPWYTYGAVAASVVLLIMVLKLYNPADQDEHIVITDASDLKENTSTTVELEEKIEHTANTNIPSPERKDDKPVATLPKPTVPGFKGKGPVPETVKIFRDHQALAKLETKKPRGLLAVDAREVSVQKREVVVYHNEGVKTETVRGKANNNRLKLAALAIKQLDKLIKPKLKFNHEETKNGEQTAMLIETGNFRFYRKTYKNN